MCQRIIINRGEKEIYTPNDFKEHFGYLPIIDDDFDESDLICCLCPVFVEETFNKNNIPFKRIGEEFHVGQIEFSHSIETK